MRVITSLFSIESLRPALDGCAPNASTRAAVKDAMNAHRDWIGLREGENRVEQLGKPTPRHRPTHGKSRLNVSFSTILIE